MDRAQFLFWVNSTVPLGVSEALFRWTLLMQFPSGLQPPVTSPNVT